MAYKRILPNWIGAYAEYTENTESPQSFHLWAGFWAIAAAAQRKVYLDFKNRNFIIYPNFYIVYVAPPAAARKSQAIKIASRFVEMLEIPMIAESTTPEALMLRAARAEQTIINTHNDTADIHTSLSMAAEEFTVFLRTKSENSNMVALLNRWFDCPESWDRDTVKHGEIKLSKMFLNFIAATTAEALAGSLSEEHINGGFTSRILFVVERTGRSRRIMSALTPRQELLEKALQNDLHYIHEHFVGPMTLTPAGLAAYKAWYEDPEENWSKGIADPRLIHYIGRKQLHILKTALVWHMACKDNFEIDEDDINTAIALVSSLEANMPWAFTGIGNNKNLSIIDNLQKYLSKYTKTGVTENQIISAFYYAARIPDLQEALRVLVKMKAIREHFDAAGVKKYFAIPDWRPNA